MSGARGEGAVIDPRARTVRLRHEPKGFVYQLRGDDAVVDVVRVDQLTGGEEPYGTIERVKGRWKARKNEDKRKTDALQLVARAWNYAPLLKERSEPETRSSLPAPLSGPRVVDGVDAPSSLDLVPRQARQGSG